MWFSHRFNQSALRTAEPRSYCTDALYGGNETADFSNLSRVAECCYFNRHCHWQYFRTDFRLFIVAIDVADDSEPRVAIFNVADAGWSFAYCNFYQCNCIDWIYFTELVATVKYTAYSGDTPTRKVGTFNVVDDGYRFSELDYF